MKIKIIKNRSDIGAGTRGSDMGIDAIEIAAINQNNDFFIVMHLSMLKRIMNLSIIKTPIILLSALSM